MATLVSRSSIIASSPPVFRGADHRHFAIASVASIASALREPQYAIFLYDRKVLFFEYVALNALHRIGEQSADAWATARRRPSILNTCRRTLGHDAKGAPGLAGCPRWQESSCVGCSLHPAP